MIRPLTEQMKSMGRDIINILDQTIDKPTSAFWFYIEDEWRLCFATVTARVEKIEDRDPLMSRLVHRISEFYTEDVNLAITAPANVMIRSMFNFFRTNSDDITGVFMHSRNKATGCITPFYVYRLCIPEFEDAHPRDEVLQSAAVCITNTTFHPDAILNISHNLMSRWGCRNIYRRDITARRKNSWEYHADTLYRL